jgi:asparagine synthase (glutamine-hydrolysing)
MCCIFALLNNKDTIVSKDFILQQFNKAQHRGPDNSSVTTSGNDLIGFHRLAINGLDELSNQPFKIGNIVLICNGEIYNYKQLYNNTSYKATTNSDCEVIIYLYMTYGIEYTLNLLDGVFAFILIDYNKNELFVARDPYGVRPLFYLYNSQKIYDTDYTDDTGDKCLLGFASEMKQLIGFTSKNNNMLIKPVLPGNYMIYKLSEDNKWFMTEEKKYTTFNYNKIVEEDINGHVDQLTNMIHDVFCEVIKKRVDTTDRPVACLLSGGLDSSIVTALVNKFYPHKLETYSIGLKNSEDLKYARMVATFLGTQHTEIIVTEEDFFNYIPHVIEKIESYDTTTVRASVGNFLVAQYISENSEAKVIFNGDGSDELMGGYLYMSHAPNHLEFDKECKRLLKDIHYFDVLRSDRSVSINGLEPRTPFLDREFVDLYLSISSQMRYNTNKKQEKYLFRKAFDRNYLPDEILWRRKEAFSDGVSSQDRSWYKIIEEKVMEQTEITYDLDKNYEHNSPQTLEQLYYRTIYEKHYPDQDLHIPYYWMPKYVDANDSSARSLDIYTDTDTEIDITNEKTNPITNN